jgi:uncharacterized protein (TIGR02302 family)
MQQFMRALAEEARRNPSVSRLPLPPNTRMLRQQDLERMLDQIERLAEMGSRDAAQQMLSELQSMLDSLRAGRPQQSEEAGQMGQMLNELGDMIRRQQELMDQTYQLDRGQRPQQGGEGAGEERPMTPEELAEALRQLQQQQQNLQQQLQDMMGQMRAMGLGENGQFGRADQSMGQAAGNLGQGEPGSAVGNQGNALEALRQGAQSLSEQMANRGMQPGPGQAGQRQGMRGGHDGTDPLGRPMRNPGPDLGTQVQVPDEIDTQRAREILDTIRKRLGESARPLLELDYLERLLQRY